MEHIARLIQGALEAVERAPEDVTEVEIEHTPFTVWSVLVHGTYVFFNMAHDHPYEPYTTVTPDSRA